MSQFFFLFWVSHLWTLRKNYATKTIICVFGQTSSLLFPLIHIRTLPMDPNLKMSIILFVLPYIRYKGRIKCQICDSKVHPWLHHQVNHQLQRQMRLFLRIFCNNLCFLKWNIRCTFKCLQRAPSRCSFKF